MRLTRMPRTRPPPWRPDERRAGGSALALGKNPTGSDTPRKRTDQRKLIGEPGVLRLGDPTQVPWRRNAREPPTQLAATDIAERLWRRRIRR